MTNRITDWVQHFIREQVHHGDICIDATMGNGNDTLLLSQLAGDTGAVLAFDIQEQALEHTALYLEENKSPKNYRLILDTHEHMAQYAKPDSAACITFNLGYLPGGDHSKATRPDSSQKAIEVGLTLLKKGGLMTICVYSGGDTGFEERDKILSYIKGLDCRRYLVIQSEYINRPNHPPIPILIWKR